METLKENKYLVAKDESNDDVQAPLSYAGEKEIWIPRGDGTFESAVIEKEGKEVTVVKLKSGSNLEVPTKDLLEKNAPQCKKLPDMARLPCLNEPCVLENMRQRYNDGIIHVSYQHYFPHLTNSSNSFRTISP